MVEAVTLVTAGGLQRVPAGWKPMATEVSTPEHWNWM